MDTRMLAGGQPGLSSGIRSLAAKEDPLDQYQWGNANEQ